MDLIRRTTLVINYFDSIIVGEVVFRLVAISIAIVEHVTERFAGLADKERSCISVRF